MTETLIPLDNSVILAADVPLDKLKPLVGDSWNIDGIGAYKIGASLGLQSLRDVVDMVHDYTDKRPIIYDHQKGGTDIPDTGTEFIDVCKKADVDAVILFPLAGPATQEAWTKAAQDAGLTVLVDGHMTHPKFLVSEGGYVADDAPQRIYTLAAEMGVRDFVVPGNKVEYVRRYRELIEGIVAPEPFRLYAPGFIDQKGVISEFAKEAGRYWHAIVGRGIYAQEDIHTAALQVTSQLRTAA